MQWSDAPQKRDQMVLFSRRLDDAIAADHPVRLFDDLLGRLDWSAWEAEYHVGRGQPAIPPRVLAGVILYGLLTRLRASRRLEEALTVRLDFLWLVEGRTIDHTTLSEFRRRHGGPLKNLFVKIGLLARELGWLPLEQLAYDGTRLRANARRSARTPAELREMRSELAKKFDELEALAATEDTRDEETLGPSSRHKLAEELSDAKRRKQRVDAALAELARAEAAGEAEPKRVPLTDPESRITPGKEGAFAPNYTPLATVDMKSGLIVAADVIASMDEDAHVADQIRKVQSDFGLASPPAEMLADGMNGTGAVLSELETMGVTLYSPLSGRNAPEENPALRSDPRQPVPEEAWERLPVKVTKRKSGVVETQLEKAAFVYDAESDCYWCPQGKRLGLKGRTSEDRGKGRVKRARYKANPSDCAGCPLRSRCLKPKSGCREISRDQHEALRERHAARMKTPEAKAKYARRRESGERPFAMIKHHFGARQFLLRGLKQVKTEWLWLTTAFNLHRLMSLLRPRAGPEGAAPSPAALT